MSGGVTSCPDTRKNQLRLNENGVHIPAPRLDVCALRFSTLHRVNPHFWSSYLHTRKSPASIPASSMYRLLQGSAVSFVRFARAIRRPLFSTPERTKANLSGDLVSQQDEQAQTG
jgi:hypothetical protein